MRAVAQLDKDGFFLYFDNDLNGLAYGAIYTLPPEEELPEHYKWRWTGERYEATADYRGKTAYKADGTIYTVEKYGALPDGHSLTPPPPPAPTLADQIAEVQAPFIAEQAAIKADFVTARMEQDAEWEADLQADYQDSLENMAAATAKLLGA